MHINKSPNHIDVYSKLPKEIQQGLREYYKEDYIEFGYE
jgi:hypothetical protein